MLIPNLVILRQICCQDLHGKIQASKKWALLTPSATFTLCSINCQIPAACQMLLAWLQPNKIKCAIHFQCWRKKKQVIRHWTPLHWSLCLKGRHPRNTLQIKYFILGGIFNLMLFLTITCEAWILRQIKLGLCPRLASKKFLFGKYLALKICETILSCLVRNIAKLNAWRFLKPIPPSFFLYH